MMKPYVACLLGLFLLTGPSTADPQDRRPERPLLPRREAPLQTAPMAAALQVPEAEDEPPAENGLEALRREMNELRRRVSELERENALLTRDNAQLIEQVGQIAAFDGRQFHPRIMANLETSERFRREFLDALNVRAEVRFYNWRGVPVRMNVNGVWHTLQPGENAIPVPYGPVTVRRSERRPPRIFTNWTPRGAGAVMVFDVGERIRTERQPADPRPGDRGY